MSKILYLGPESPLIKFLEENGEEVTQREDEVNANDIAEFDWVVSYGYRYILSREVVASKKKRIVNLHIAYLPWNRGASPNYWSWKESTPKGVTIHYIDEGIDTGQIIIQERVVFSKGETLKSSYAKLQAEMQELFRKNWKWIKAGRFEGSYHKSSDMPDLKKGWDTPVGEII